MSMQYWEDTTEYSDYSDYYSNAETNEESDGDYWERKRNNKARKKRKRLLIIITALILAAALAVGVFFVVRAQNRKREQEESIFNDGKFRYFHTQMNGDDLRNYDSALLSISNLYEDCNIKTDDIDTVDILFEKVRADNPECFWLGGEAECEYLENNSGYSARIKFNYNCGEEEIPARQAQIDENVEKAISNLTGLSEYQKVKAVYDYVITNSKYDESVDDQSCYSVLVNGKGVCAGYAAAMQLILNRIGIDTITVYGTADGEQHAWNIVKIGGSWFQLDAIWGDPVSEDGTELITYDYFLITDEEMLKDHSYLDGFEYPKCTETLEEKENDDLAPVITFEKTGIEITFLDVGQADASLVICEGHAMLIDGGNVDDSQFIYAYLKQKSVDKLDYIICTHPHEDHAGGLAGALNYATADKVFCTTDSYESKAFNSFKKYVEKQNRHICIPDAGDTFKLGDATCTVLAPVKGNSISENTSIILRIQYGDVSFLFTGDAQYEDEQELMTSYDNIESTVLKVGHHGSDTSTGYQFLYEVNPSYAVISVGKDNKYGHPSEAVLSRLNDAGVTTLRTDLNGTVVCNSDGININFYSER